MEDKESYEFDNIERMIKTSIQARKDELLHKFYNSEQSNIIFKQLVGRAELNRILKGDPMLINLQNELNKLYTTRISETIITTTD